MLKRVLLAVSSTMFISQITLASSRDQVAKRVIARVAGKDVAKKVNIKITPNKKSNPAYKYHAENGKLFLEATDPVAACRGFYDYVRNNNMGMVGWRGAVLRIPKKLPNSEETDLTSPFKFNQMYNVVTAGYSFPYWNWKRWEHELDWMALHGYNMILDPVATEAIAERVWLKLGLTQQEIDDFVCGPAHAPWHRMGNIAKVDGPLPKAWHKDQIALQHKLLKRMKALKITPVFQGFAGFVPYGMKRLYPNEKYYVTHWNGGFSHERAPIYIMPDSKLYKKLLTMYIKEWEKEFGKGKYYLIDTFNELKKMPGKEGQSMVDIMSEYGRNLSSMLAKINPNAVWALQGWIFSYQGDIWTPEVVKALLSKVPDDKMLIFDMMGVWRKYKGFYGKPWIYGMITNMGGRTPYTGDFNLYIRGPQSVIDTKEKGNNVGNSNHSEGVETNEVIFELIADTGWETNIDIDKWLKKYCINRYGACPEKMYEVWMYLKNNEYSHQRWGSFAGWQQGRPKDNKRFSQGFFENTKKFLSMHKKFKNSPFYQDDAVEMASFVLSQKADEFLDAANKALSVDDLDAYKKNKSRGIKYLLLADRLLASHSLYRLERWVDFAKSHSKDKALQEYYEENAKRIITSWGPPVNDYSARVWSGLIRDFYVPRIEAYLKSKEDGTGYNQNEWEDKWLHTPGISKVKPYKDPAATAYKIVSSVMKAKPELITEVKEGDVIGEWTPGTIKDKWVTLEWPIDASKISKIAGVKFKYTKGSHRLDIKSAELVCDGSTVAKDVHNGSTGVSNNRNVYHFKLRKKVRANNGALIRATIKSSGGTDSYGQVDLLLK